ncbi:hypothetical protein MMC09_004592 [Bachmanniomyces sp. S44760]|nr:hypothetical protein [Bachmanniomyces sp. S44760]
MDTSAYLSRQGWRGTGHPLHHTGRGIKKPLLVSKKSNVLGIGNKPHAAQSNQWWSRAFDDSLKCLKVGQDDSSHDGSTEPVASVQTNPKATPTRWTSHGGLYRNFVQGEGLQGTRDSDTKAGVGIVTPEINPGDSSRQGPPSRPRRSEEKMSLSLVKPTEENVSGSKSRVDDQREKRKKRKLDVAQQNGKHSELGDSLLSNDGDAHKTGQQRPRQTTNATSSPDTANDINGLGLNARASNTSSETLAELPISKRRRKEARKAARREARSSRHVEVKQGNS